MSALLTAHLEDDVSITDERRSALLSKMEVALGPDETATLMEIIETIPFSDLATKADLDRFATKADLERFATKADLERFATKEYLDQRLERFATKDDLHTLTKSLITWMLAGQATLVAMIGILVMFAI